MARQTLSALDADYTMSVDIALHGIGNLQQYCWAYGFAAGTDQYVGLVNSPNNTNWYYTIKDEASTNAASRGGLSYGVWHNLTYVQDGEHGRLYVDGRLTGEVLVGQRPASMADAITSAWIGRSPFEADALMAETFFDNFRIYDSALDGNQARELYAQVKDKATTAPEVALSEDKAALAHLMKKFNYLHATTELPAQTENGTPLEWTLEVDEAWADAVTLDGTTLHVGRLPQDGEAVVAGTLKATSENMNVEQTLRLAPDDNRHGYLYCFMNAGTEITNFALGTKEDKGHVFNVLLGGGEIFDTEAIAGIEHGTRDAYIGRGEGTDEYFITTTDMKQHASGVWNNRGINLIRSNDLVHWESTTFNFTQGKSVFSDPEATTGVYDTDEEYARINRVWAPQFIWDETGNGGEGAYLVYYSILSSNEGDTRDRIFYSYADREFKTLTQPRLFFDPGVSVIDADIVFNPYDSLYHMYYKREGATGSARGIYEATSDRLVGGTWTEVMHVDNEGSEQVEGSSTVRRINEDVYNLYYMRYSGGNAYKYCETDHLGLNVGPSANLEGSGAFQHGSVMTVTEEEYDMLQAWSDVKLFLPQIQSLKEESGSSVFDAAIRQAEEALELTGLSNLAQALPAAYAALQASLAEYAEGISGGADLTFLLQNPEFTTDGSGWTGTSFTAASSGVAEFYDKTFDTYQVLKNMPAGTYRFQCQGFYRDGDYAVAYPAHNDGSEQLRAVLYVNDRSCPFMSLFDDSAPYTYTPYTYPDNVWTANSAFNTDGEYTDNFVEYTLDETGDLQVGMRKDTYKTHDWTCFDNFRLYYYGKGDGIREATDDNNAPVDVYTLSGVKLRENAAPAQATKGLPRGLYIVGKKENAGKMIPGPWESETHPPPRPQRPGGVFYMMPAMAQTDKPLRGHTSPPLRAAPHAESGRMPCGERNRTFRKVLEYSPQSTLADGARRRGASGPTGCRRAHACRPAGAPSRTGERLGRQPAASPAVHFPVLRVRHFRHAKDMARHMVTGQARLHPRHKGGIVRPARIGQQQHQGLAQPAVRHGSQGERHTDERLQAPLVFLYLDFDAPAVHGVVRTAHDGESAVGMQARHIVRFQILLADFRRMDHQRAAQRKREGHTRERRVGPRGVRPVERAQGDVRQRFGHAIGGIDATRHAGQPALQGLVHGAPRPR